MLRRRSSNAVAAPPPEPVAPRRRLLCGLATLPLAGFATSLYSDPVPVDGACSARTASARPLFIPRGSGYLGRLEPRGAPLTFVAAARGPLPASLTHGPLAYRVRHRGREYVNPTLVLKQGERVRITLDNRLDTDTIAHWHGLAVDTRNDGNGVTLVSPGRTYDYDFEVRDRGALYWYHPHPHGATGRQTYGGLYGAIEVTDADETQLRNALDLVPGRSEFALVLQDRRAAPGFAPTSADTVHGFLGDELYVNGTHCAYLDVATRMYRLRVLNACNARTLRLALCTAGGTRVPLIVIGNDGGLLPAPARVQDVFLASAERIDVLVDLSDAPAGETLVLETLAFDPMLAEYGAPAASDHAAMGGPSAATADSDTHAGTWPEGAPRAVLELRVRTRVRYERKLPDVLAPLAPIDTSAARERPFRLGYNKGRWRINDRVFAMGETPIEVARDTTEVWLLRNYHTSMPHAMHLHGFHFEVQERETSPEFLQPLQVDDRGRLAGDLGRKDTVLVWPGESVRIAIRFAMPFPGPQTYMFHCHNLEHEDGGMMLGVKVG